MADAPDHGELVAQFVELTGAPSAAAQQYLSVNHWDLSAAATEYFTAIEEGTAGEGEEMETDEPEAEPYTGPRTLDGRPAPQAIPSVGSSSKAAPPKKKGGIATLSSMNQSSAGPHAGHAHDSDDSDDEDYEPDEQPRDLFAGGEKSGLAVQDPSSNRNDPRKVVNDILKKARANATRPGGGEPSASTPPTRFRGSGQTLGGDGTDSQVIPDPNPRVAEQEATVTRILHLWEDGFSIEDGPLRRFDDPGNAADLQMIRQGRAPLHLMGVRPDQPIDVQLIKHDDNYKAPPKVYKPFSGSGQRLGSPTPGATSSSTSRPSAPTTSQVQTPSPLATAEPVIDPSQPTVTLRIQLANGTRLPARFNASQTIGDVYGFVERAHPDSQTRPWVLATTFPNKDHTDKSLALSEVPEFKRGGTAVQKWT